MHTYKKIIHQKTVLKVTVVTCLINCPLQSSLCSSSLLSNRVESTDSLRGRIRELETECKKLSMDMKLKEEQIRDLEGKCQVRRNSAFSSVWHQLSRLPSVNLTHCRLKMLITSNKIIIRAWVKICIPHLDGPSLTKSHRWFPIILRFNGCVGPSVINLQKWVRTWIWNDCECFG